MKRLGPVTRQDSLRHQRLCQRKLLGRIAPCKTVHTCRDEEFTIGPFYNWIFLLSVSCTTFGWQKYTCNYNPFLENKFDSAAKNPPSKALSKQLKTCEVKKTSPEPCLNSFNNRSQYITVPTQTMHYYKGNPLELQKITIKLHCLIPPTWVPFNDPCSI